MTELSNNNKLLDNLLSPPSCDPFLMAILGKNKLLKCIFPSDMFNGQNNRSLRNAFFDETNFYSLEINNLMKEYFPSFYVIKSENDFPFIWISKSHNYIIIFSKYRINLEYLCIPFQIIEYSNSIELRKEIWALVIE